MITRLDTEGGDDMFPVIETAVFLVIALFLFGFGMRLMRRLDSYLGEQSHLKAEEEPQQENP